MKTRSLPANETIRGATLTPDGALFTWGGKLRIWSLPDLTSRVLVDGPFAEGGCAFDVNADGRLDLVLQRGIGLGRLVWLEAPAWRERAIDSDVEMHDCLGASLLGRRGLLITQRHMQVRFYSIPKNPGAAWPLREIYSFYTASNQTGLLLTDIDGDRLPDIVCGNYWIRSPEKFELPWRLFAMNTHSETPESAMSRFVWLHSPDQLAVSQGHEREGRLMIFRRPPDPKQLWFEKLLSAGVELRYPHGLAVHRRKILVGENNGPGSRLLAFTEAGKPQILGTCEGVLTIFNHGGFAITAGPGNVSLWRLPD